MPSFGVTGNNREHADTESRILDGCGASGTSGGLVTAELKPKACVRVTPNLSTRLERHIVVKVLQQGAYSASDSLKFLKKESVQIKGSFSAADSNSIYVKSRIQQRNHSPAA